MSGDRLHIHLDLVGGIAGDMFVAAAIDAGLVQPQTLQQQLRKVGLGPIEVGVETVMRGAIEGKRVVFGGWDEEAEADHRHLSTIREIIAESSLSDSVKRRALQMFELLGRAEVDIHGIELEKVHFHEVGAVDSILDFVSAAFIIEEMGEANWSVSTVPLGRGTIDTAHGTIPLPAPATARILQGFEVEYRDVDSEFVTPTGATILAAVAGQDAMGRGKMGATGFGCGSRDVSGISNVLRMVVLEQRANGALSDELPGDLQLQTVVQLVTEIDDETPELTAYVADLLRAKGALDVVSEPVQMKKGRTGVRLSVLCIPEDEQQLVAHLLRETTTLGVRRIPMERWTLPRSQQVVTTEFGDIRVKIAHWDGAVLKVSPEFDCCARRAAEAGVAWREVFDAATAAARQTIEGDES